MGHLMRPMLYFALSPLPRSKDGGDLLQRAFRRLVLSLIFSLVPSDDVEGQRPPLTGLHGGVELVGTRSVFVIGG
jgi:hypothetical protein